MKLAPQTWGNPYWNMNLNFSIDPKNALSSFMNVRNISIGIAYGVSFRSNWSLESYVSLLNLKGTAFGVNTIYTFAL
jgi:hypothetical protein